MGEDSQLRMDMEVDSKHWKHSRPNLIRLSMRDGLSLRWQVLILAILLVAIFTRRPSLFFHAQFYAEDGAIWYAEAYNGGWLHSLSLPDGGYLNTLQRLVTGAALLVPFKDAPFVDALAGMLIQAIPVVILLSGRCRNWASFTTRCLFAALYVALPNTSETHVLMTNSQWHLALAQVLLAFAEAPRSWKGRAVDTMVFLLGGFSGPFCIILIPLVLLFYWLRRERWSLVIAGLMSLGISAQIYELLHVASRYRAFLGATPSEFLRMLGGEIVLCSILGTNSRTESIPMPLILVGVVVCLGIYWYCLRHAPLAFKLFTAFCGLLLCAALKQPLITGPKPLWNLLLLAPMSRYWFFPSLAFVWGAAWCAINAKARFFRVLGSGLMVFMLIGIIRDWHYRAFPDEHFGTYAKELKEARPGDSVVIPIVPEGWRMKLVKKGGTALD